MPVIFNFHVQVLIILVLNLSRLELNVWLRFSGLGRFECWFSNVSVNLIVTIFRVKDVGAGLIALVWLSH
jgi:hypothetical protein